MSELSAFVRDVKGIKRAQQVNNLKLEMAFLKLAYNHLPYLPLRAQRRAIVLLTALANKSQPQRLNSFQCQRIGMVA